MFRLLNFSPRYFAKAARKTKQPRIQAVPSRPEFHVRGVPVRIVDSVESARNVARILSNLPREAVVAWNIESTDIDTKRFHTAGGTGGRILAASCTATGVDFGGGSQSVFIDALPLSGGEDLDADEVCEYSPIISEFKSYFESESFLKCSHSIADDFHVLLQHGIRLRGIESDTRYLARLANTALSSWEGSADELSEGGYELRSLSKSLAGSVFEFENKKIDKFLKKSSGPKIAHFSPTMRPYWISKTVESAVLTLQLHNMLKQQLEETRWKSEVMRNHESSMWDLACTIHRPLLEILAEVEDTGMGIDLNFLNSVRTQTQALVESHASAFRNSCASMKDPFDKSSYLNCDADMINPHSPQQVRQLLFGSPSPKQSDWFSFTEKGAKTFIPRSEKFQSTNNGDQLSLSIQGIGLRAIKSKMNKKRLSDFSQKGLPSVNQKLLIEYAGKDPENGVFGKAARKDQLGVYGEDYAQLGCLMLYHLANISKYEYVLSSFIDPLIERLNADGTRIHPSLSLDTSTGRLACRKPNIHNPPNASDTLGLRSAFTAGPGNVLIVADYSQLELRILAHVTDCESMIKSLRAGGDYHSWTAVDMFAHVRDAVNEGRCTVVGGSDVPNVKHMFPGERSKAKAVNFSIAYGKCARSIAEDLDCTLAEAEELLSDWYASKPEVASWKTETIFKARVSKKVESIMGRTRDIPHIDSKLWKGRSERAAVNHCIQGSAADIAICAMIQIGQSQEVKRLGYKLLMQIHDEFIIEGPQENANEAKSILVNLMQNPFHMLNPHYVFRVPLEVDAGVGPNWADAKP